MRPAKVKILGKPYKVHFVTDAPLDEDDMGECRASEQAVYVKEGLPLEAEQDTLLHEVIHGVEWEMDLKLKESDVKKLATGLLAVLKENPRFSAFLRRKAR